MKHLSTSNRLILLVTVMVALLMMVGTFGLVGIYKSNDSLKTVYADRTVPMWQLSEIQRLMQRVWLILAVGQDARSPEFIAPYLQDADANLVAVHQLLEAYLKTSMTPEEEVLAEQLQRDLSKFEEEGFRPALIALKAENYEEVRRLQMDIMVPKSPSYRSNLQALTKLQLDVASVEYKAAISRFDDIRIASIGSMLVGLVVAVLFGGFLVRSIIQSKTDFERSLQLKRDLERQLQQSQKVQALGQLTGGIAHDFNNILAAILGYSNLALDRHVADKDSKLAKYLREIISASERARDLVAKMLTFTRTKPSEDASLIEPSIVVEEVISMMAHSIPSSIELALQVDDKSPVMMDAGELNQVIVNLVINARDAIQARTQAQGHGRIDILLHRVRIFNEISLTSQRRFSGEFLAIEVSDTGTGISPEALPRLFDPFFTTKDVGKGTGLGLSMVQGIMLRSGGHILVQTKLGKGSTFKLLLPVACEVISSSAVGDPDTEDSRVKFSKEARKDEGLQQGRFSNR